MRTISPLTNRAGATKARRVACVCGLALVAALLGLAGCSLLPKAQPDPTRFFLLSAPTAPGASVPAGAPVVVVRPVELASYLKSRPILVRRGMNEVEFRDFARWGEPLEQGIARVLREELIARGVAAEGALKLANGANGLELTVRVLACEGSAEGAVLFRATWEITRTAPKTETVARGDFHATDLMWDGKNEALLAGRLSDAVAALAQEIAGKVGKKD